MPLNSDLARLAEALDRHGGAAAYHGEAVVRLLLNALAGLLEAIPPGTPMGQVLEPALRALPAGVFARQELQHLAAGAGRGQEPYLITPAGQAAATLPGGDRPAPPPHRPRRRASGQAAVQGGQPTRQEGRFRWIVRCAGG
jgi:hypothetical protein